MSLIRNKTDFKTSMVYLGITVFSLVLMALYYALDHGLRDIRMTLLFLPSLVFSLLFFLLNLKGKVETSIWRMFFHMGFAAIWFYLLLSAIISMAEAENPHVLLFLYLGISLYIVSFITFLVKKRHISDHA